MSSDQVRTQIQDLRDNQLSLRRGISRLEEQKALERARLLRFIVAHQTEIDINRTISELGIDFSGISLYHHTNLSKQIYTA